ncbi:uncharacterized protein [Porites lutea]|uniref:uncharacterized protein isoform X2 n=1 Tax=Porites lutea TaxID=51062 RepID=UPI003CC6A3C3
MEGEGVYGAAHDLGVEWIIIKGVSDFADGTTSETNSWRPFASLMAASLVAHILKNPIIFENWGHYNDGKSSLLSSLVIKDGVPTSDVLQHLSLKLGTSWKPLARCLKFDKASITVFHKENEEFTEKALSMLQKWKAKYGSGATFRFLHNALCDERVCQRELAEQFCYC